MLYTIIISNREEIIQKVKTSVTKDTKCCVEKNFKAFLSNSKNKKIFSILFLDIVSIDKELIASTEKIKILVSEIKRQYPQLKIIALNTVEEIRKAVDFVRSGAENYITEPIIDEEVRLVIDEVIQDIRQEEELKYLRDTFWKEEFSEIIKTNSPLMKKVYDKLRAVAATKSTVMISGDTGTGKGVLAKLIHHHSNRSDKSFISVHCGSIPDTLIESELFGHEKGAFTGADRKKLGKFEIANSGTIFLDEIGTISASAQIKLLQVLQDKFFQRVGGESNINVDVRVVSATNENLQNLINKEKFRKDLYFRLNVFPIEIPPLKDRTEDIEHLVRLMLRKLNVEHLKEVADIHPLVLEAFKNYSWPGNIRELENVLERAFILEKSNMIQPDKFPEEIYGVPKIIEVHDCNIKIPFSEAKKRANEEFEKNYVKKLLLEASGKINLAAEIANITPRYLREIMEKYGIDKKEFKKLLSTEVINT